MPCILISQTYVSLCPKPKINPPARAAAFGTKTSIYRRDLPTEPSFLEADLVVNCYLTPDLHVMHVTYVKFKALRNVRLAVLSD